MSEIESVFGTTDLAYFRSVLEILDRDPGAAFSELGISPVMLARIKAVARRRIWVSS